MAARRIIFARPFCFFYVKLQSLRRWCMDRQRHRADAQHRQGPPPVFGLKKISTKPLLAACFVKNIGVKYLKMKRGKQTWGRPSQCAATDVIYVCSTRAMLDVLH